MSYKESRESPSLSKTTKVMPYSLSSSNSTKVRQRLRPIDWLTQNIDQTGTSTVIVILSTSMIKYTIYLFIVLWLVDSVQLSFMTKRQKDQIWAKNGQERDIVTTFSLYRSSYLGKEKSSLGVKKKKGI